MAFLALAAPAPAPATLMLPAAAHATATHAFSWTFLSQAGRGAATDRLRRVVVDEVVGEDVADPHGSVRAEARAEAVGAAVAAPFGADLLRVVDEQAHHDVAARRLRRRAAGRGLGRRRIDLGEFVARPFDISCRVLRGQGSSRVPTRRPPCGSRARRAPRQLEAALRDAVGRRRAHRRRAAGAGCTR
mmetsp:Transcript_4147/g.13109  ORF Transcript_4147/g.13109 Transcript_4147/m.13109 type:complete len:188 (+) Transcript_4147:737-1300(+)